MTQLLIAGDTHGNKTHVKYLVERAVEHNCSLILQLGDFGYFPHTNNGQHFLRMVEKACKAADIELWWLPGNHENWDMIRNRVPRSDGRVSISQHVKLLPQGCRFEIDGTRFGCLGGAFSVDWRGRRPGFSWWEDEVPTDEDVATLGTDPLDVLLTHDTPMGVDLPGWPNLPVQDELRGEAVRELVKQAILNTRPQLLLHGHWHIRHSTEVYYPDPQSSELQWVSARVEGFANDGLPGSWAILDLPALTISNP